MNMATKTKKSALAKLSLQLSHLAIPECLNTFDVVYAFLSAAMVYGHVPYDWELIQDILLKMATAAIADQEEFRYLRHGTSPGIGF